MSSEESNSVPQEEAPASETQKDQLKKERLAELRKLKEQYAKVSRYNSKAVELEARRLKSDSYVPREDRAEWAASKAKEERELKRKGISSENAHMMESAETAEKKYESKKQKEENRIKNYGWSIFGEESLIRGYEKRLKALPTTPESVAAYDEAHDSADVLGVTSRLSKEAINRVVSEQKKREERHQKFSKRRTFYNQEKVDYINERNRVYNRKLDRYFDRYTTDIRANLERGTAL